MTSATTALTTQQLAGVRLHLVIVCQWLNGW